MKTPTRRFTIVACSFIAGVLLCYVWFRSHLSPATLTDTVKPTLSFSSNVPPLGSVKFAFADAVPAAQPISFELSTNVPLAAPVEFRFNPISPK